MQGRLWDPESTELFPDGVTVLADADALTGATDPDYASLLTAVDGPRPSFVRVCELHRDWGLRC